MSLLDGKVTLDGERGGNNNRQNNNRGGNNNRYDKKPRRYNEGGYQFSHSSYLTDEMRDEYEQEDNQEQEVQRDKRADEINEFVDNFTDNSQDFRKLIDIIADDLPDVVRHIRSYYNPKNNPQFIDANNRLIKLAGTSNFCKALAKVLEGGYWQEDGVYDRCFRNVAFLLSTALETAYERMHTDVVRKYATDILPRMWKPEITEITTQTGITKDLALDLIIAIPMMGAEWNGSTIDAFYARFLDKMLIHAEDNMDVLNWEVQGMLYDRFFNKDGKNTKTGLKVIGKYLTSEPKKEDELDSEVVVAVYNDFKKMLYSKLDTYDIKDISYVFKFVAGFRKDNEDKETIFTANDISNFENVRKGLLQTMDDDKETMSYLA